MAEEAPRVDIENGFGAKNILGSTWGRLFENWDTLRIPKDDLKTPGWQDVGKKPVKLKRSMLKLMLRAFGVLGTAVKEAPEFSASKHRRKFKS